MAPNVILVDADYIDRVAATLGSHFAADLKRDIPAADLAQWLVCVALDSRMEGDVQVVFIHDRETKAMLRFAPGNFNLNIDGKAFAEPSVGEFTMACCPVERVTTSGELCAESLESILEEKEVRRVAVVYDFDATTAVSRTLTQRVVKLCAKNAETDDAKDVTLFTMVPIEGCDVPQMLTGYSLMAAMGIGSSEL